jgi:2-haloacid dehalogenase
MLTAPTYIFFDIGNTLVDCNPRYLYRKLFDTEEEMEYFLREICSSEWNSRQDAGNSTADGAATLCRLHP